MMGGNLRRRSVTGSLIVLGAVALLSACGGGHKEDDPITPSYVGSYRVSLNLAFNNCGGSPAGALSQIHVITQVDRNVLVERDNIAYQGAVEVDNKGFVAFSNAEGRPDPEGRLFYRHTANPALYTVEQTEFYSGGCRISYSGTSIRI
jgi:hypothetical protein